MFKSLKRTRYAAIALATATAIGAGLSTSAYAQVVSDRALSDVKVDRVGSCTTLTVNFNIRVQLLSYFPTEGGRELHIRIRPLDTGGAGLLRESLRTPTTVPELRSIEYEGDNPSGPVLSLFFTRDMRFDIQAGTQPQSLVIRLDQPDSGEICAAGGAATMTPSGVVSRPGGTAPAIPIPAGLYAINLVSQTDPLGLLTDDQRAALSGKVVYEMIFQRESEQWHRLRVGFFESRDEADKAANALMAQFPDSWVVKVTADERAQAVANRIDLGEAVAPQAAPQAAASPDEIAQTASLTAEAEQAITDGNNDRAIQLLTKALTLPENANSARALELLGLTRERKQQSAQARAAYEEYLRRFPSGEAADRVKQRLAALTAAPPPGQLRAPSGAHAANEWVWGLRGSFSQFYFRDQSSTTFVDASRPDINAEPNNTVNLNQLLSTADVTISGGNDRRQILIRAAGSYAFDFRASTPTHKVNDIKSLTALYVDYSENDLGLSMRLGRQTRNSSGVLGRFDGLLLGFQVKPKLRFNLVGGFPVLTSRQTWVLKDRYFYGASVDIGAKQSPLQTTLYWFDQRAKGGFIDRQSVGLEARYLKSRFNAFALIDYDVKYNKLNLGLATLNYRFPDQSNISVTADYRQSPLLTTSNALIGMQVAQLDPVTHMPVYTLDPQSAVVQAFQAPDNVAGLQPYFTDAEIYGLAQDRTIVTKSLTVSYARPITKNLQANIDFTVTHAGGYPGTPAVTYTDSSGMPTTPLLFLTQEIGAQPATGTEYFYGLQFVGSGLLMENDIYILSGRYSNTQSKHTWTLDFNARVPVTSKFRVSPRLRYGHRSDKFMDDNFQQFQPTIRLNYYPVRHSEVEVEFGANFTHEKAIVGGVLNTTSESGYVLTAGYRFDF